MQAYHAFVYHVGEAVVGLVGFMIMMVVLYFLNGFIAKIFSMIVPDCIADFLSKAILFVMKLFANIILTATIAAVPALFIKSFVGLFSESLANDIEWPLFFLFLIPVIYIRHKTNWSLG